MLDERRKKENTALRDLVDALKRLIDARDALWALSIVDRLFRPQKCRAVFNAYDYARELVQRAVRAVMQASAVREENPEHPLPRSREPLISMEEFNVLLGKPQLLRKVPRKRPNAGDEA